MSPIGTGPELGLFPETPDPSQHEHDTILQNTGCLLFFWSGNLSPTCLQKAHDCLQIEGVSDVSPSTNKAWSK